MTMLFSSLIFLFHVVNTCALPTSPSLQNALKGLSFNVTIPQDHGYSFVSTAYNLRYNLKPAAVAYPSSARDVADVVAVAAQHGYKVVARSGGHSYTAGGLGTMDGLVVVDLKGLNQVSINTATNVANVGPGLFLGKLAEEMSAHGRALPHGTCPTVAVGGHAASGGYGFFSRKHGLLLDRIRSIEVVLANATIARVSRDVNPDLFWALRGSASSFGIITSVAAEMVPMPPSTTVFQYHWSLSAADLSKALDTYQKWVSRSDLPPELGSELLLSPGSRSGLVSMSIIGSFYDVNAKFNAAISPFLASLPKPAWSTVKAGTYIDSVHHYGKDSWASHDTFYAKSLITPANSLMSAKARDAFAAYLSKNAFGAETNWFLQIGAFGGPASRVNQVPLDETSFAHRNSLLLIQFYTSASHGAPQFPPSGFTLLDGMVNSIVENSPLGWNYGTYVNYPDDRLNDWQRLYYGDHYSRLQRLKLQYDPNNLFSYKMSVVGA